MTTLKETWGLRLGEGEAVREKERAARRARAAADPFWFCEYYFPHYYYSGIAEWQKDCQKDYEGTDKPQCFAVPRGHGKTVTAQTMYTARDLLTGRKRFGVFIAATVIMGDSRRDDLLSELENNERIIEDFGADRRGERIVAWKTGKSGIRFANGALFVSKGAGQSLRGLRDGVNRPDLCICDDLDRDEQQYSPVRLEKLIRWMTNVVIPLAGAEGMKLLVIGNLIGRQTLMQWCLDHEEFTGTKYKAIKDDGALLMPNLWTHEALDAMRRKMGSSQFACEFQNEPADEGTQPFREEWLKKRWTAADLSEMAEETVWIALDPSKGKTSQSDYQAIVAIRRNWRTDDIVIQKADLGRRPPLQLMDRLIGFVMAIGPSKIASVGIESVQFQEFLADIFDLACRKAGITLKVVKIQQTLHKYDRVTRLQPHVEGGRLWFPDSSEPAMDESMRLLYDQLIGFPNAKYDDGPDALEMAVDLSNMSRAGGGPFVAPFSAFDRNPRAPFNWRDPDQWPDGYGPKRDNP